MKGRKRDPIRVGSQLGRVLHELGHGQVARSLRVARLWEQVVGAEAAASSEPTGLSGGVLEVSVASSVWAQQLQLRQTELLAALSRALGEDAPTALRFRVG